jgi:hypothetical protein
MQGHRSHSQAGEPGTGMISRLETSAQKPLEGTCSRLETCRGTGHRSHSQAGEPGTGMISRLETCRGTEATHSLVSQGQE